MTDNILKIWVRADAGPEIGYGHVKRTLTVLSELATRKKISVNYIMTADSDTLPIIDAGWNLVSTGQKFGTNWAKHINGNGGLLILDSYNIFEEDLVNLRSLSIPVIMFDDGCRLKTYMADMVIDSAPQADKLDYRGLKNTCFCLGLAFYPLREEFRNVLPRTEQPGLARHIAITFGGSDPDDSTGKYLEAVGSIDNIELIDVILGPGYRGVAEETYNDKRINFIRHTDKMAKFLRNSDLALSASGGTAIELSYLGVPGVLIALSPDQEPIAKNLSQAGVARYLGRLEDVSIDDVKIELEYLIKDKNMRQSMSKNGRNIVDGSGAERIVDNILKIVDGWRED